MLFSSPIFLFGFLPVVLTLYYLAFGRGKNFVLLASSILFYTWGEVFYVWIMLFSIVINYYLGRSIGFTASSSRRKLFLTIGVVLNLLLLVSCKYANFLSDNLNLVLTAIDINAIELEPVHLPLGISFFTFQALSYLVDVYRKEVQAQRSIYNLALYISLFPQLIAGPIVRYHDVANQIESRNHTAELYLSGVQRFVFGLAKKMLIANPLGEVADGIFSTDTAELGFGLAWLGIICYSLQIYFDFSGYSDMAIGLGRMFGFRFLENFNYPYVSQSIQEFWRRWHISLSTWFRDYLYIPLGGNRVSEFRVYLNLFIVFFLTGLWHGASWNFIVWGLFHGLFLVTERLGFSNVLARVHPLFRHIYVIFTVMIGWVFFRADSLTHALDFLGVMLNPWGSATQAYQYGLLVTTESLLSLFIGLVLSTPLIRVLYVKLCSPQLALNQIVFELGRCFLVGSVFLLAVVKVASSTYNPFIYFRF